ncbi:MAG: hypothetical protein GVY36_01525 [Verrucomicrobia bacterium]|jgi:antitoxin (DNA-binding transcriptional repressor) of toxin-antitoxin stability system|nr:hypothetical protein [Verrucomicrobiota bacterium]
MKTISTCELLTDHKSVQASLASGESLTWTSRGKVVGRLIPPPVAEAENSERPDLVARARDIGAVNKSPTTVAQWVSEDRDQ